MRLTVLICVHSNDKLHDDLLMSAIQSLTTQTYTEFNVLVVLDECWSNTKPLIEEKNFDLNIKLVERVEKEGLAYAKNFGLELIDTEYVAFLDGDDLYDSEKIEKQLEYFDNNDVDFLGTHCWNKYLSTKQYKVSCFKVNENVTHKEISDKINDGNVMTHGSMMIKKKCLDDLGGYNHIKGMEDWDLWKRAIKKYKFHQLPERLYILTIGTSVAR